MTSCFPYAEYQSFSQYKPSQNYVHWQHTEFFIRNCNHLLGKNSGENVRGYIILLKIVSTRIALSNQKSTILVEIS